MYSDNNLFQFATKELSQDAILAWTVNGINGSDELLRCLGKELLNAFVGWTNEIDFSDVVVTRQVKNMDILISFQSDGKQHLVIVEDKVGSSIHDDQLSRYITTVLGMSEIPYHDAYWKEHKLKISHDCIVHPVYVKTGLFTDIDDIAIKETINIVEKKCEKMGYDKLRICGIQTLKLGRLIEIYSNTVYADNYIIKMFSKYLTSLEKYNKGINRIINDSILDNRNDWRDLLLTEEGQWYLMKMIIPIENSKLTFSYRMGTDTDIIKENIAYQYNGSSHGTPWTQTCFWAETIAAEYSNADNGPFYRCMFWRLDYNRLSLRYYIRYKSNDALKSQDNLLKSDRDYIKKARKILREIVKNHELDSIGFHIPDDVESEKHMENTLLSIYLTEMKRPKIKENQLLPLKKLIECIRIIHEEFITEFNKEVDVKNPAIAFRGIT